MKKLTLTIGIPAHNEEKNIENMIESLIVQNEISFLLERILVVLDGCTDRTFYLVKNLSKRDRRIKIISDGKRMGKATRLNQIYKLNRSQLLGTFDADIVFANENNLEIMVKKFINNKKVKVVAGLQTPFLSRNWMGKFSDASFMMLQTASMMWRNGNNIHSLQGSASIIESSFAKSIQIPPTTTCDQGYLYISAIQEGRSGFKLARYTKIFFRSPSTLKDWRLLGARTIHYDKENVLKDFGKEALSEYAMPNIYIYKAIFIIFLHDPLEAIGSIIMNLYIRIFPYALINKRSGIWKITKSSKTTINL